MLNAIQSLVESFGILALGLLLRLGIFLLVLAAVAAPVLVALALWQGARDGVRRLLGLERLDGFAWRRNLRYAEGHTWLSAVDARAVRLGLDDVARRLFPRPVRVTLPAAGTRVLAGDPVALVESGRHHALIASPVAGKLTAVNPVLARHPDLLRSDPYFRGWLVRLEPGGGEARLHEGPGARAWMNAEARRFGRLVEAELGIAAADGGEPGRAPVEALDEPQWRRVAEAILKPEARSPSEQG